MLVSAFLAGHAPAMTHTEEHLRSAREKEAAQEKARRDQEQQQLKRIEECDRTARQQYPDRKQRDRYYEDCVSRALGGPK